MAKRLARDGVVVMGRVALGARASREGTVGIVKILAMVMQALAKESMAPHFEGKELSFSQPLRYRHCWGGGAPLRCRLRGGTPSLCCPCRGREGAPPPLYKGARPGEGGNVLVADNIHAPVTE